MRRHWALMEGASTARLGTGGGFLRAGQAGCVGRARRRCRSREEPGWGWLACEQHAEGQDRGCDGGLYGWKGRGLQAHEKNHFLWCSERASHGGFPTQGSRPWLPSQGKVVVCREDLAHCPASAPGPTVPTPVSGTASLPEPCSAGNKMPFA